MTIDEAEEKIDRVIELLEQLVKQGENTTVQRLEVRVPETLQPGEIARIVRGKIQNETPGEDEESRWCPICQDYMLTIDDYCLDCGSDT